MLQPVESDNDRVGVYARVWDLCSNGRINEKRDRSRNNPFIPHRRLWSFSGGIMLGGNGSFNPEIRVSLRLHVRRGGRNDSVFNWLEHAVRMGSGSGFSG